MFKNIIGLTASRHQLENWNIVEVYLTTFHKFYIRPHKIN